MFVNHCGWVQFGSVRVGVVVALGVLDNASALERVVVVQQQRRCRRIL